MLAKNDQAIEYYEKCYNLDVKLGGENAMVNAKPLTGIGQVYFN